MVVAEGFRAFLFDTVTGVVTTVFPPSKVAWGIRLNGPGSIQASIKVMAAEVRNLDITNATTVVRQSLGIAYNATILEAGPIWETDYDAEAEEMHLTATGIWSIFDARKALPGNYPGAALKTTSTGDARYPTGAVISLRNLSLGSIGRELVRLSIQDNPFTRADGTNAGSLPIVLPPVVAGTHSQDYNGFDLGWIGDRLRQLTGVDNGPDMRFRARFREDDQTRVEYVFEHGSEARPLLQQSGPDWFWDTGVERSGVVKLGVRRNAQGIAARAWVPGNGQERNMLLAWQTDPTYVRLGFPWTETDVAAKDVEDLAILQSGADRLLSDSRAPWDEWTLTVRADQAPFLGDYLPGDWASINVGPGHPIIPADIYRVRVIAIDGDHTEAVKLTVAPIQGRF